MDINSLTIGEAKEIASMFPGIAAENRLANDGEIRIAVLQRGHVIVGKYAQQGDIATLSSAHVVRRWGTSAGLGEIAQKGPLGETRLDACPPISFHIREVIFLMEVNADAWGKQCN